MSGFGKQVQKSLQNLKETTEAKKTKYHDQIMELNRNQDKDKEELNAKLHEAQRNVTQ